MVRTSDDKKAFYLYNDYIDHVKLMSDEDAGKLFKAILEYENDLEVQELSGVAAMAFSFIKNQLDRDSSKYEEICKKNRANGTAKPNGCGRKPRKPDGFRTGNRRNTGQEACEESKFIS